MSTTHSTLRHSNSFYHWLIAIRPKTLSASVVPVFIGAALARAQGEISFLILSTIVITALLIQIATNLANDVFDYEKGADTSERLGPLRATQSGLISPSQMKRATMLVLLTAVCTGAYLVSHGGLPILIIGLLSVICTILYTAGPFPLAYMGLGDVFVLVFFGPVAVSGTYYLLTKSLTSHAVFAGLAPGMLACAVLVVNNLRDIDSDKKSGKNTLAVRFGSAFSKTEYLVLVLCAALVPLLGVLIFSQQIPLLIACLYLLPAQKIVQRVFSASGPTLNLALADTAKLMLIYGLLYCIGVLL